MIGKMLIKPGTIRQLTIWIGWHLLQVKQAESVVCAVIKLSSLLLGAQPLGNAVTHSPDVQVPTIHDLFVKYFLYSWYKKGEHEFLYDMYLYVFIF